ncbi:MAG: helix-turn-helix domain containing protein, partial [Endozoicomonadaceae bacterium]|nr:helix-turn-helix domain containing protein [Endozoicomonadaceae bacterium]MCY4329390.1 helix-turn-helix domain containing protein [Endozoicomonadaceae bacterium]
GLAAEALPVCSPDNQEQSETSAIVLGKVTISPKEVQTIIEFNKNGFPADIIATSVGYSAKIVDQIIREQANSEVQEPINENNNVQLQEPSEKTVKFIEEHIKEKVLQQKKTTTQKTKNESAIKVGDIEISQEKVEAIIADENKIPQEVIASKYGYSKSTIKEVLIKANVSSQEIAIKTGIYYIDLKNVKDIIDQIDRGVPPSKIAEETGYSVRTINRIKKAKMLHV